MQPYYLEVVVGVRDFLREQRSRFRTQADMLDYIEHKAGKKISQPTMSLWLSGARYPDRSSRAILKQAFAVPATGSVAIELTDFVDVPLARVVAYGQLSYSSLATLP